MNDAIQFHSRVGDDGILNLQVNLGQQEAKKDVVVTVERLTAGEAPTQSAELGWSDFVERTYGSCAGLGLERHAEGEVEAREPIE
jgi:hypothetical protein